MEKGLRQRHDALIRGMAAAEGRRKEMDERFILNEVQALWRNSPQMRGVSREILREETEMEQGLDRQWEGLRAAAVEFEAGAQTREKRIWELEVKTQEEFVDFFKKLNVHEISLIRNIQYDIDSMIKKTDIFNWSHSDEFSHHF